MPALRRTALLLSRIGLAVLVAAASSLHGQSQSGVESAISFSLERTSLTLHEPVLVDIEIANRISQPIDVDLGRNSKENIVVTVTTPEGKHLRYVPPPRREGIWFPGKVHLEPGENYSQTMVLNEWFKFEELGRYQVHIRLASAVHSRDAVLPTTSVSIPLEITNRSPERLEATCQDLVRRIEIARSYKESSEAALALSYVADSMAIPYLEQALRNHMVADIAVAGLKRINSSESIQALIRALRIPDQDTALLARSALQLLENETSDPTAHSLIEEALQRR